jgi:hypothetical protein
MSMMRPPLSPGDTRPRRPRRAAAIAVSLLFAGCGDAVPPLPPVDQVCQVTAEKVIDSYQLGSVVAACESSEPYRGFLASGGTAYLASAADICALDGSGLRPLAAIDASNRSGVAGMWRDGDRMVFVEGSRLRARPLAGGASVDLASSTTGIGEKVFTYHNPSVYSGLLLNDNAYLQRLAIGATQLEPLSMARLPARDHEGVPLGGNAIVGMAAADPYLDFLVGGDHMALFRLPLASGTPATPLFLRRFNAGAALLGNDGTASWVRASVPQSAEDLEFPAQDFTLYRVGADGQVTRAWSSHQPWLFAESLATAGDAVYAGGHMGFAAGDYRLVVVRVQPAPQVLGCLPPDPLGGVPGTLAALAADGDSLYGLFKGDEDRRWALYRLAR